MSAVNPTLTNAGGLFAPYGLTITARAISSGHLTCLQVVERCLAHAAASEKQVSAWVLLEPEAAISVARRLDRELLVNGPRSALDGIPIAVKDVIDVKGLPTRAGSRVVDHSLAVRDADIVKALRDLGAIVLGKANTHEFAYGATTPPTRNPVDPSRIAGGSSGGSAAAVAAGSALLGVGSDTGGSVRLPAALCGVAGWRPLRNSQIGLSGIIPLSAEFDEWGLMAASAADLALVRDCLWGAPAHSAGVPALAVPVHPELTMPGLQSEVASAFASAVDRLSMDGIDVVRTAMPDFSAWRGPRMAIQMRQVLQEHRKMGWWPARRHLYSEETRLNLEAAEAREDDGLEFCREQLKALDAQIDAILDVSPVLAVPTVPVVAPSASELAQVRQKPGERHPMVGLLGLGTLPFSRAELTSLTVPIRHDQTHLPIGIQFVARDDSILFEMAARLEATTF